LSALLRRWVTNRRSSKVAEHIGCLAQLGSPFFLRMIAGDRSGL
jgi:hypothetical protein